MTGNGQGETQESNTIGRYLVDLVMNQDQVSQRWVQFLITIEAGLAVALGFLWGKEKPNLPGVVLYLIPPIGIFVAGALTWIVVRERKWQAWYVARFNMLPWGDKVFPYDKGNKGPVRSQPMGRIGQIVFGLGILIAVAWIAVLWGMCM